MRQEGYKPQEIQWALFVENRIYPLKIKAHGRAHLDDIHVTRVSSWATQNGYRLRLPSVYSGGASDIRLLNVYMAFDFMF